MRFVWKVGMGSWQCNVVGLGCCLTIYNFFYLVRSGCFVGLFFVCVASGRLYFFLTERNGRLDSLSFMRSVGG